MRSKQYYVEFVGQHGAGKTRTIHEIVNRDMLAPYAAVYPQQLQRSRVHFACSVPLLLVLHIRHVWFVGRFLLQYAKWNWINYHAAARHLIKMVVLHPYYESRFDFDIWMKDDMLHLLPRIEFQDGVEVIAVFRKYFNHFAYRYNGVVYIELPYDVMMQRFEQRFRARDPKRKENRTPVYERAFQQNKLLKQVLTEQTLVPVLVIDGTHDVSDNAQQVVAFIRTHIYGN
ncbi:MAG: hypothetical protein WDZ93_00810 [Candidatus Paceibacterota bacterium]